LNFGTLFDFDALVLDGGALVLEFGDREARVALNLVLLVDVVHCQLDHSLTESCVFQAFIHGDGRPDAVDYHARFSLFIVLFAAFTHGKRESIAHFTGTIFLLIFLRNHLFLEAFDVFVLAHIDEDLAYVLRISLHDESFFWLNNGATFLVNQRFSVSVFPAAKHAFKLLGNLTLLEHLTELKNLLMGEFLKAGGLLSLSLGEACKTILVISLLALGTTVTLIVDGDALSSLRQFTLKVLHSLNKFIIE
jgi:hypothetical protein